ncbi:MAG: DUF1036 domain-containing protein [Caulobacteraceae bacterium]|nr:MAG: DUF1036 domain-containing protein [Caulobacteraceae bacterium]
MRSSHVIIVAAVALAAMPLAAQAQSKPGTYNKAGSTVDLRVCNYSGRSATVAVSYVEVGGSRFMNRGWYDVADGACTELVSTDNSNFYFYADATGGSGRNWQGSHTLCVEYPGPYSFYSTGASECEYGQELRSFTAFTAAEVGPWTWTLDP